VLLADGINPRLAYTIGEMDRRSFIKSAAAGSIAAARSSAAQNVSQDFELSEATVSSLQEAMRSGRLTARSITQLYLDRIGRLDRSGPELRAIMELNPDAMKIADSLDAERKARGPRGPLHGIPVLLKDNINTTRPMTTTAGSLALEGSIPPREAVIAKRLRDAGAILLGKANMSEWANFRSARSTSGWSARAGQCRNPYVLDRSPLGSSSGSAVAAAANLCPITIGTETDGSIVSPSSVCGVVGFKPTVGLLSTAGIIPVAHSQDTAGPICRSVEDAAVLLTVLAGGQDYARSLQRDGMKNARIGVARSLFVPNRDVEDTIATALDTIKMLGAELIDIENLGTAGGDEFDVLLYEFKADLNAYFSTLNGRFRQLTLKSLIDFNERNRDRELVFFGQELFQRAEAKGPLTDKAYLTALENCRRITRTEGIDAAISTYKLDAIVAPTCGPAGIINPGRGDVYSGRAAGLPAVAGYPHITVPGGFANELPLGISFFGGARSEPTLLRVAFAFEQATKVRRPPRFVTSLG
jgi:amidase